jgi:23S rRNA (cytidine1920-2'-O)/16S rRNA (cytidine1409-2'-O)-methyltransferase
MSRSRLDAALVERGLAPTRARAQAAVAAGRVRVDGAVIDRPATPVTDTTTLEVDPGAPFVSRGGEKLAGALDDLAIDVSGVDALDLGASTGGFTDCLLQRGARRVIAVDVGYGQLAWSLRTDDRVAVMERTNARSLMADSLPFRPNFVTCDLAFISIATVWPAVVASLATEFRGALLVKPQFEVGKANVGSGGVVRDPALHRAAVVRIAEAVGALGGVVTGVVASRLIGPKGNREFVLAVADAVTGTACAHRDAAIDAAVEQAP